MKLDQLGLQIVVPWAHPMAGNFRPPIWPPPPDWAPIVDAHGNAQCRYADTAWPLDIWAGKPLKVNFGDGRTRGKTLDRSNAEFLRQCATWFIWGPRGCRTATSLKDKFTRIKPLFAVCAREGIVATDLMRFDSVIDKVAAALPRAHYDNSLVVLHELLDARESLGFCLLDQDGLARLARLAPDHEKKQTPYIPPRIWTHQVSRLRECLEDYRSHQSQVEDCFNHCLDLYARNYGSLKAAVNSKHGGNRAPFSRSKAKAHAGAFELTADHFGVTQLMNKWVGPFTRQKGEKQIGMFSKYLDLVSKAGLAYMLNFSLMRVEECWNLRSDCLQIENDPGFGEIYLLCGETTKTDPDADARWPVSSSVSLSVDVMKHIAALRMRCARERDDIGLTAGDISNPYLVSYQYEPWSKGKHKSYRMRPVVVPYEALIRGYPRLLDPAQMVVTEEDHRIARLITPSLDVNTFKVGVPWRLGWHQLRRTGAVNMLSSGMVDESSLQLLLKHLSRAMTLYYGRNHSRLALNEEARALFLKTMYEEIARDLQKLASPQFVSPLGAGRKEAIVTFIREVDAESLDKAARKSLVRARRIRLGFCANHLACPYGGVESIAHCLGGDNGKGCVDLLVDSGKKSDIECYERVVDGQIETVHPHSPRHLSLQSEKRAIRKYYDLIRA